MNFIDIIEKKKENKALTEEEIKFFIENYVKGEIPDYQVSALLMAIYFNKLNLDETYYLTKYMIESGDTVDLTDVHGVKVDKHSTGGVGDTVTLVLGPLMASVGLVFAKMSGRGLGHTGGTLDKLEAIPGFNIYLNEEEFKNNLEKSNIAVIGQTDDIVPADKLLYALRDATDTVDNVSLISSSILSKKIALGTDALVLDIKVGSGAFMKDKESAIELSKLMVELGKKFNRNTKAIITNMSEPLGDAVGNSIEVIEAIKTLRGEGSKNLREISIKIGSSLMNMAGLTDSEEEAKKIIIEKIESGEALEKFKEMVELQGGDSTYIDDISKFKLSSIEESVIAEESGYVKEIEALEIGIVSRDLGAGRLKKGDDLDLGAGIYLYKKVGDYVKKGDKLATIYTEKADEVERAVERIKKAYKYSDEKEEYKLIIEEID
ncbi:pyrimidine-nucleoside phosphorylase [Peptoniphilus sp. MSJ-1]|uniref:Pyrimidine-nucleoside phosphorylase n=1 Tax=Peptoniphilus ovalis TaxID=2841503 RepID=A0ABS6FG66_9FIRM|nr:pyrimidine-nucleoside phosphorylase [Peptoniphilus ovalis]MBU5669174.1 pyrimidine-nucleoside phosphorylase [Peptoniphilus ovalis]